MEQQSLISLAITLGIILYCKMIAMSKKPNRTMERMNLHRAGLVVNKRYSDPNEANEIGLGEWDDDSEGRYVPSSN
jgi:hypothetical protein